MSDRPKIRVVPTSGRFEDRRKAKLLERFIESKREEIEVEVARRMVLVMLYGPDESHWPN
jgi:hypothetical protein